MKTTKTTLKNSSGGGVLKGYYFSIFIVALLTTTFLALNLIPLLTKTGNSNAESTDVTVEIDPVLSLRLSKDEINLNPSPIPEGTFAYDTLSAIVDTNNKTGYTLTMNSETEEAALVQEDEETKIPSLTTNATVTNTNQNNFTMNRWGYALTSTLSDSGTTFNKIPALSTPDTIAESEGPIAGDTTPVSFATRVDTSLPSGTYNNTITFTATANPLIQPPEINSDLAKAFLDAKAKYEVANDGKSYYTMQSMTDDICSAVSTPDKTIIDVPEVTLVDSRDGETYIVRKLADGNCWMSQNLRLKLFTNRPLTPTDSDIYANWTPNLDSQITTGTYWGYDIEELNKDYSYIDANNKEYGGYYNWHAATAGSGTYGSTDATASICPKGWQLPETMPKVSSKNFAKLYYTYYGDKGHNNEMLRAPISIVLSNSYVSDDIADYNTGGTAYLWSSTSYYEDVAFGMSVSENYASMQDYRYNNKSYGQSVRCVSRSPQQTINFDSSEADYGIASASADLGSNLDLSYYSSLFKKDGYVLKQWKDQDGNLYDATSTSVNVNPGNNKTITLTAVWDKLPPTFSGITKMQEMTASICAAETTPTKNATRSTIYHSDDTNLVPEATLTDTRDNNTYTVRKLADGNCWMAQNLRIVGSRTLTSADSDVSSNYTLPAAQTSAFTNSSNNNQVGAVQSSYGNGAYYSWYAATAGTGTAAMSTKNEKATSSICPKGWQLPEGGASTNKSFNNLITTTYGIASSAAGSTALQAQPLQFVLAGFYGTSGFGNGGSGGNYWSSSVNDASYAYNLSFNSSIVYPLGYNLKYYGFSVRCVAR